jgi:hypothetical protein
MHRTRKGRPPWLENAAVFLLLAGSLLIPWGWLLGVVLAWSSRVWTVRDKLIATLCPPGGFFLAIWIAFGSSSGEACSGGITSSGRTWEHCTGGPTPFMQGVWIAAAVVLFVMPFATALYLHRRALRPPRAQLALS